MWASPACRRDRGVEGPNTCCSANRSTARETAARKVRCFRGDRRASAQCDAYLMVTRARSSVTLCSRYTERDGAKVLSSGGGAPRAVSKAYGAFRAAHRSSAQRDAHSMMTRARPAVTRLSPACRRDRGVEGPNTCCSANRSTARETAASGYGHRTGQVRDLAWTRPCAGGFPSVACDAPLARFAAAARVRPAVAVGQDTQRYGAKLLSRERRPTATLCSKYTERHGAKVLSSGGGAPRAVSKANGAFRANHRASATRDAIWVFARDSGR
jgi:hypothetical protein